MRRTFRYQPRLEYLESMALLSALSAGLHHAAADIKADATPPSSTTPTIISLNGTLKGTYQITPGIPDTGTNYTFSGKGTVRPVGSSDVTGHVRQLGFVATGRAEGLAVISTPQGSLTLTLEGPKQKGFAQLPDRFSFKITNSSGNYLKDRGHGTLVLVVDPAKAAADHGSFTMVLVSKT